MLTKKRNLGGQSVVEVMVAVTLFVLLASTSVAVILGSFASSRSGEDETRAAIMAAEGMDAAESIRNQSWSNLTTGNHGISKLGNVWSFSGASDSQGKFTRVVAVTQVLRNASGNIVLSAGSVDPDTKRIITQISWVNTVGITSTVELSKYLTNWQTAGLYTPTSCNQICVVNGKLSGICRGNLNQCSAAGETYIAGGDIYCTGGASADTCCCR